MPTFEVARSMILAGISPLGVERVDLLSSPGRVVAEDVAAPWDMPFYDNSAMDGFAVLPKEKTFFSPGEEVAVHLLRSAVGMPEA